MLCDMFAGNECRYYYGIEPECCAPESITQYLSGEHQNWIFLEFPMSDEVRLQIESKGFICELIQEKGRVGNNVMSIYRVTV